MKSKFSKGGINKELDECLAVPSETDSKYQEGELGLLLDAFLRSIDRESRIIFIQRYWYMNSIREISSHFNISDSKVIASLFRTRNRLKAYLVKEGYDI